MDALIDLFWDHRKNVAMYPQMQAYIRDAKLPVIIFWGDKDPIFVPGGAEAYKADAPQAVIKHIPGAHFLLETHLVRYQRQS